MRKVLLYSLVILAVCVASCGRRVVRGTGESTTVNTGVSGNFSAIDVAAPVTVHVQVQPGASGSVQYSGYRNLIDELDTRVEGNVLRIENKHTLDFDTDKEVVANITVGSLSELGIHGAADADVKGDVTGNVFKLVISGAGDVSVDEVHVGNLEAKISGAGNVEIVSGTAGKAEYKVSGAGDINSFGVVAEDVKARVSGAGDIKVFANKTLEARVSGAGSVHYKGSASVRSETSGIGSVVAAN